MPPARRVPEEIPPIAEVIGRIRAHLPDDSLSAADRLVARNFLAGLPFASAEGERFAGLTRMLSRMIEDATRAASGWPRRLPQGMPASLMFALHLARTLEGDLRGVSMPGEGVARGEAAGPR